jgi:hypothetical protein
MKTRGRVHRGPAFFGIPTSVSSFPQFTIGDPKATRDHLFSRVLSPAYLLDRKQKLFSHPPVIINDHLKKNDYALSSEKVIAAELTQA